MRGHDYRVCVFLGDEGKFGLALASEALFNLVRLAQAVGFIGAGFWRLGNSEMFKNFPPTKIGFITKGTFMGEYIEPFHCVASLSKALPHSWGRSVDDRPSVVKISNYERQQQD